MAGVAKPGRNELCSCGSGRKLKRCCGAAGSSSDTARASRTQLAERLWRVAEGRLAAGQAEQALGPLLQANQLVPDDPAILNNLGIACLFSRRLPEAVAWLRRSIAVRPNIARAHYNLGLALAQSADVEAALAAHRRAVELDPTMAEAHGRLADILQYQGNSAEAARSYERASAAAPDTPFGCLWQAKALATTNRLDEAVQRLEKLVAREPSDREPSRWRAEAHLVLGHVLNEVGRFDEAAIHLQRALALAPWQVSAYHGLVSSRRLTDADRPLVTRILSRLEARDVAEGERMTLHFAAGKALDDLKDYEAAIRQFDAANEIRRRLGSFDRSHFEARVGRLTSRFTRELFATGAALGEGDETPVLVLGMPRSGTTLIERVVSSHPKVRGGGELSFWNDRGAAWAESPTVPTSNALRRDYLRLLRGIGPDALRVTDKMPFNFLWIGLVHLLLPNARIIHCRRNPIDTCLSIYSTHFRQTWGFASERGDLAFTYRQYLRLMEHWRAVVAPDRLLEVDYEEATAAPEATARRLIAFCGLEWDTACLQPERNPDPVMTASKWQARQPIYRSSVERWRSYEPWLGELRGLLP